MELGLKVLLFIAGIFLAAAFLCFDSYAVGLVAEHAYMLLIAPNINGAPALSWKVFSGLAFIYGIMTLTVNQIKSENDDKASGKDSMALVMKYLILAVAYMAIGWLA